MPSYKPYTPPHRLPSLSSPSSIISDSAAALLQLNRDSSWIAPVNLPRLDSRQHERAIRDQQVIFTRQLWRRSMPVDSSDANDSGLIVKSGEASNTVSATSEQALDRRASTVTSTRSHRQPSSPSRGSRTPLTPEESPPFRTTRKRTISALENNDDDRPLDSAATSPSHARTDSGETTSSQVCICQPDPKIPRPRNAFILYRQHHQAKVIADHPGLANPEISKIIGEQWRNQPAEVKNEWKRLAEEEKVRHQQQYPSYRYQPKRNTRRNSLTDTPTSASSQDARCQKCGGRTVAAPGSYSSTTREASPAVASHPPQTPASITTPTSRTLPILRDLSGRSPSSQRMVRPFHPTDMSPRHVEVDDLLPVSPDHKRRRTNSEHPVAMYRAMPPRYNVAPIGTAVSPTSHYNYVQPHPYPHGQLVQARRESLPSLHMMSSPGPMGPPPRPGMGYQAHRLSQGHTAPDRSLTLPPLQANSSGASPSTSRSSDNSKSAKDVIMSLSLSLKLEVLRQIAPPTALSKDHPRGPLIAVEGDDAEAAKSLAQWLTETLSKDEETKVRLIEAPDLTTEGSVEDAMAEYHMLAASWLKKTKELARELSYSPLQPAERESSSEETADKMQLDISEKTESAEDAAQESGSASIEEAEPVKKTSTEETTEVKPRISPADTGPSEQLFSTTRLQQTSRPVLIAPTYSLRATNHFSCNIPIVDAYGPKEHWQWNATLWRGIIGPDLTIYVRDADEADSRRAVEQSETERLFMVKRVVHDKDEGAEIDSATLRRVGFEVSEWIRAFGARVT